MATLPSATRAAVSRALARSRMGRASSKPYFCMPARSAWPGRGRVSGAFRARPSSRAGSTGSADITVSHLGHSVLPMPTATGPPWVSPCRMPPMMLTASASNFIRAPRPNPSRRRASASAMSALVTRTCAGRPSRIATSEGPCDSPAVSHLSMPASLSRWSPRPRPRLRVSTPVLAAPRPARHPSPAARPRHVPSAVIRRAGSAGSGGRGRVRRYGRRARPGRRGTAGRVRRRSRSSARSGAAPGRPAGPAH